LLFLQLQLLGLALVLVNQLLLIVNLIATLSLSIGKLLLLEVLHSALALSNHLSDRLSLHVLDVEVLDIVLLLAHLVLLELILDRLGALELAHVHVVAGILHVFAALLLALEGCVAALTLLLLTMLLLQLLLSHTHKQRRYHHYLSQE